ncbi:MAG: hypothetical protein COX57_05825 [Alphaproteobacteria bacterium CG_4_10_14_0_2_um_filter_63_37]|nr:MAG: hypothetical protein COX57_05825 [Alphaproteobacteria bacterium CG_4_10_14_0_2_um_filter_63_37]
MNKAEFCRQIVQAVDNCRNLDGMTDEEVAVELQQFLSCLEPKDRENFAQWGYPGCRSTPNECWD